MAPMATKNAMVLLLLAILPLAALSSSRAGPSAHKSHSHGHGHGPKHPSSPPPSPSPPPPAAAAALVRATCNSTTYPELCVSALGADPSSATADVRGLSAIAVSAAAANASGGAATAAALVRATCNSTTYPDLCVSTLGADPSSATADVRGLSAIAVSAAAANASGGAATAAALQAPAAAGDATVQALLRTCAAKYGDARDALSAARESIAAQDYDFASVHVSAAAEYPQVCRVLFRRQRPGQYPPELAAREEALSRLCSVALDIIALVSNSS